MTSGSHPANIYPVLVGFSPNFGVSAPDNTPGNTLSVNTSSPSTPSVYVIVNVFILQEFPSLTYHASVSQVQVHASNHSSGIVSTYFHSASGLLVSAGTNSSHSQTWRYFPSHFNLESGSSQLHRGCTQCICEESPMLNNCQGIGFHSESYHVYVKYTHELVL